jgi:alkylated DNA nucleotide flippase Atl1
MHPDDYANFELIEDQVGKALDAIEAVKSGRTLPYKTAMHLIGIAGYIRDVASEIKARRESGK